MQNYLRNRYIKRSVVKQLKLEINNHDETSCAFKIKLNPEFNTFHSSLFAHSTETCVRGGRQRIVRRSVSSCSDWDDHNFWEIINGEFVSDKQRETHP